MFCNLYYKKNCLFNNNKNYNFHIINKKILKVVVKGMAFTL